MSTYSQNKHTQRHLVEVQNTISNCENWEMIQNNIDFATLIITGWLYGIHVHECIVCILKSTPTGQYVMLKLNVLACLSQCVNGLLF